MWLLIGQGTTNAPSPIAPQPATAIATEPEPEPEPARQEPSAPPPPSAAKPEPPTPPEQPTQTLPAEQGPASEYRKTFESESRAADSPAFEAKLREAFTDAKPKSPLFDSVECRRTICRIRLNWSLLHFQTYLSAMNRARPLYELPIAASTTGPENQDGIQPLEVFVKHSAEIPTP